MAKIYQLKKYLLIVSVGILGCSSLGYLYFKGLGKFQKDHQDILEQFATLQKSDITIDKEILNIQYFLLGIDDTLIEPIQKIEKFCDLSEMQYFFNSASLDYDAAFENFCTASAAKLVNVSDLRKETKSYKDAVRLIRNAHYSKNRSIQSELLKPFLARILSFAFQPEIAMKRELLSKLNRLERLLAPQDKISKLQLSAAQVILQNRLRLDQLITTILTAETLPLIVNLRNIYFDDYDRDRATAIKFRNILFATSLLMFLFVVYNTSLLVKTTYALKRSNENLEVRVQQRTQELSDAKAKVTEQQGALLNSAKMKALGEMAAGVAHEINTPLATIHMRTNQILDNLNETPLNLEFFRESLEKIDQTTIRISKIIKGLVTFSREGNKDEKELVSARQLVNDTFAFCSDRFKRKSVEFELVPGIDELIYCRPIEITQVFVNLFNNAIDAIEALPDRWLRVEMNAHAKTLIILITDSGPGIPKDIQEKILQPFFTTKDRGKGTGLGLSISREIIQSHHGWLSINNSFTHTCFQINLPVAKGQLT